MASDKIRVWLGRADGYEADALARQAGEALEAAGFRPASGSNVLVKPNLLFADPLGIAHTHPLVVRAACLYLLDCGCRVSVSDSPGFGRAGRVAAVTGIASALPGSIRVCEMGPKVKKDLSQGGRAGISRRALEADLILNLPKFKAHRMMRLSLAVKNLFGCVSGVEKAVLHSKHGDKLRGGVSLFPSLIADIVSRLPPCAALLDGITAMHRSGPMRGSPLDLNFIAASSSSVALDTAVYTLLGQNPKLFPIWAELRRRGAAGAFAGDLEWIGLEPENVDLSSFELPLSLDSESFNPVNLCISGIKRAAAYIKK